MTAVNVRPLFTAASLACASRSSLNRIVVLIHQSIQLRHQYVNPPRSITVSLGWKSGVSLLYLMRRPKT